MRIRTIAGAAKELKAMDPFTAVNDKTIRRWIADGAIAAQKVGTRNLVDLDTVIAYMGGNSNAQTLQN